MFKYKLVKTKKYVNFNDWNVRSTLFGTVCKSVIVMGSEPHKPSSTAVEIINNLSRQ